MAEENSIRVGFGLRLKAARERKGLTQQQVADAFSIGKGTVSAWETGGGLPDALRLRRLAKMYDVSADALLWDDSLTPEAMQFAAQFDALTERQRRTFRAMWLAYFEQAKEDSHVEDSYGLPPRVEPLRVHEPVPRVSPRPPTPSRYVATDKPGSGKVAQPKAPPVPHKK